MGMGRRIAGAISTIVVVAVSGCTTTVAGQVVPSGAVKAAPVTASAPAAVEPALRWVPYNGPPIELPRDWTGGQIGNAPRPGIALGQEQVNGPLKDCTAGPLIHRTDGSEKTGWLTAGHCDENPGAPVYIFADHAAKEAAELGSFTDRLDDHLSQDSAALWTDVPADPAATKIAGHFPITGVMPEAEVKQLPAGTWVCVDGGWTGVKCSTLTERPADRIRYRPMTDKGDSGGPLFLLSSLDNHATLIGIVKGADVFGNDEATFMAPALARLGAEAITSD